MEIEKKESDTLSNKFWGHFLSMFGAEEQGLEKLIIQLSIIGVDFVNRHNLLSEQRNLGGQVLICLLKIGKLEGIDLNLDIQFSSDEMPPPEYVFLRLMLKFAFL